MKNWITCEADIVLLTANFTPGRTGPIDHIDLHHNAGNLSVEGCFNTWLTRPGSSHYQVEASGRIGQLVWDRDTAWGNGGSPRFGHSTTAAQRQAEAARQGQSNATGLIVEHANDTFDPTWTVYPQAVEDGAHLVAALSHLYGIGQPVWMKTVFPHSEYAATRCPGALNGEQTAAYLARSQFWFDAMAADSRPVVNPPVAPSHPHVKTIEELAREAIVGGWGNGQDRITRLSAAGYDAGAVQARINEIVLGHPEPGPSSYTISDMADQVINGIWGNNPARQQRLTAAGYDYWAIQAEVNRRYA